MKYFIYAFLSAVTLGASIPDSMAWDYTRPALPQWGGTTIVEEPEFGGGSRITITEPDSDSFTGWSKQSFRCTTDLTGKTTCKETY